MPYENVYRNPQGRLKLPFADLHRLLGAHDVRISRRHEVPAFWNMFQFLPSVMILAGRLRSHLSRYEEPTWVNVPFDELFLDTQAVVLFLRQFMEDVAHVVRAVLPPQIHHQMPGSFTDLAARIRAAGPKRDELLAAVLPQTDPFRKFLVTEEPWLQEVKDMRDDICHRTIYERLRTATFPSFINLMSAGGGLAPFLSEADLRVYLCGLFQRWLALACLTGEFVPRRIREDLPEPQVPLADGFIVREGENSPPLGGIVMTVDAASLEGLEYFLTNP
jgi:hypothetical protein